MQRIRITRSARKHKIGNAHIYVAIADADTPTVEGEVLVYVGRDDRNIELRIVAIPDDRHPDSLAVIHVMPTSY